MLHCTFAEKALQAQKSPQGPDFSKLITHRFAGFDEAVKAFEMASKTKDADGNLVLKVVIDSSEDPKSKI